VSHGSPFAYRHQLDDGNTRCFVQVDDIEWFDAVLRAMSPGSVKHNERARMRSRTQFAAVRVFAIFGVTLIGAPGCRTPHAPVTPTPIFRFTTDESWLNLHHFLYVLARAKNGEADSRREAVAAAPGDEARGLATLPVADQRVWHDAVASYSGGLARRDLVFADTLATITRLLAAAADRESLEGVPISPSLRTTLEAAMRVYRKYWWPVHRSWNHEWVQETRTDLARLGTTMLDRLQRTYRLPWPREGYPVHLSGFSNWAGAYSTMGNLLVVSTTAANPRGPVGVEAVFHESVHQWDDSVTAWIAVHARRQNRAVPRDLSHAMIFYTTGEIMRALVPNYTTYAEAAGIWNRNLGKHLPALRREWQPYLDGKVSLDSALARLVAAAPSTE
jgi:hypothetical protein